MSKPKKMRAKAWAVVKRGSLVWTVYGEPLISRTKGNAPAEPGEYVVRVEIREIGGKK